MVSFPHSRKLMLFLLANYVLKKLLLLSVIMESRISLYEKAIKQQNNPQAMVDLAVLYLYDKTIPIHVSRAMQLLRRAIHQYGYPYAMSSLASFYMKHGTPSERLQVVALFERALRKEETTEFLSGLAYALMDDTCGKTDPKRAVQMWERILRLDEDAFWMEELALVLLRTPTFRSQKRRALKLYKGAIKLSNDAEMMNRLGMCYGGGTSLQICCKCESKWYERAIKAGGSTAAKFNLALLLSGTGTPSWLRDPRRAAQLVEDLYEKERTEEITLFLADLYSKVGEVLNCGRSLELYEMAAFEFDSNLARNEICNLLLGSEHGLLDYARAVEFWRKDYERNRCAGSLRSMCSILWSGATGVPRERRRALHLLQHETAEISAEEVSMQRFEVGAQGIDEVILERLPKMVSMPLFGKLVQGIVLSERRSVEDKRLAEEVFRSILKDEARKDVFVWMPLSLRRCAFDLPYHGGARCESSEVRRTGFMWAVARLNLGSLLLEKEDNKDGAVKAEAVKQYEKAMESNVRSMAMLNLGFVLWNGVGVVGAVGADKRRGKALFERAADESSCALATELLERANPNAS
ncbi:unnamed protein product [Agarophyton chilense]